jgi:agmatine/peptidylarginine deiminase
MVKISLITTLGLFCLVASTATAQNKIKPTAEQKQAAYDALRQMTPEQRKAKFLKEHKRKPEVLPASAIKSAPTNTMKTTGTTAIVPNDARFPGEFEEVQAVFISWPYTYDVVPVIDTMLSAPSTKIYTKLADGIQKSNAMVYINVWDAVDTFAIKACMAINGTPLTNYRFFIYEGDNIWARDFGPVNYYYDTDDKLGWVDFKYYPGRDFDNVLTQKWGSELGIPVALSNIYQEGGNILTDGTQNTVTSSSVFDQNRNYYGYSSSRTRDSLKSHLRLSRLDTLKALPHDGGTGHVDLYLDMTDENTFVYTKMPTAMASVSGFTDYIIANNNIDTLKKRIGYHGFPYHFLNIPFPTRDDGTWYASATDYKNYTRTYSNHLIVNKSIIQPIFSDGLSGNVAGDAAAIDSIKKAYPGYNIVPIDMRYLDGSGGSIHCITKEVAAANPVRFLHYEYRELESYQSSYPIDAIITNKSGISAATLYWRLKGASSWTRVTMTAASGNHWLASIPASSGLSMEVFEYYILATSINGKTMTRPMPGADGPFVFWYDKTSSINEQKVDGLTLGNLYPNPTTDQVNMELIVTKPLDISLNISDMFGKVVVSQDFGKIHNTQFLSLKTDILSPGIYSINVINEGKRVASRKLIKK